MTPDQFVAKWQVNTRTERAAAQEHFLDLCALLEEPTPNSDPDGSAYAFEKGATKATGGEGWADVWRRGCFAWEYKRKGRSLDAAMDQLLRYAGALENPPLLVVSDIATIRIRTNWTNAVAEWHELVLAELRDPLRRRLLKNVFSDPDSLRPAKTRQKLTEEVAGEFAQLATSLRARGHAPQQVAHFLNRLVFCLFADDVNLLPPGLFEEMLAAAARKPESFVALAAELFGAMAVQGGRVGFRDVAWFNGGLFDDASALPLLAADIALLARVAQQDWDEIDPSILGTLFERGLDPDKRSQLGAHYTDRDKIERLIDPVIRRPLLAEWALAKERIVAAQARAAAARKGSKTRRDAEILARAAYTGFLERLRAFRILDPACGSGNFLYLGLIALKDIELRAGLEAEALGLQRELLMGVGPEQVLGIEINPYAAELARVSVWIGHIQWARRNGLPPPENPILRPLDTIQCRDAIINEDGSPALWPRADVVVGNPPYLGAKLMKRRLGVRETNAIRALYEGRLPAFTDLVCYWFENARALIEAGELVRAGLVATNSIRKNTNLPVMKRIVASTCIFDAWSEEKWTIDGAAVDVSLICFGDSGSEATRLNGEVVDHINADLTTGLDLTRAKPLHENRDGAFLGIQKSGPFDVPGDLARAWMSEPTNPHGRSNAEVLKPYWNGDDVTGRPRDVWFIDLPIGLDRGDAALFASPFRHVATTPDEDGKLVEELRSNLGERAGPRWWEPHWPRPEMRSRIAALSRYIVTPETAEHRLFVWLSYPVLPDKNLIVIPREDDLMFGVLHSRFHEAWALRKGSDLQDRPRYTHTTTFATFPFPDGMTPRDDVASARQRPAAAAIERAARRLDELRSGWLNPPDLVERVPEIVPGFPDRIVPRNERAAAILRKRTLTALYNARGTPEGAWLDSLHRALDEAVAEAYGWPADLSDDALLARLLALNLERATAEKG